MAQRCSHCGRTEAQHKKRPCVDVEGFARLFGNMPTTQQLGNGDHEYGQMPLLEWVDERIANCKRIAATKSHADSEGWLEDAWYFEQIRRVLLLQKMTTTETVVTAILPPREGNG